jgi:tRNA(Ile)-lysidine synthase TilS/MesJ
MLNALRGRGFPYFEITCIFISGAFTCGASVDIKNMKKMCSSLNVNFVEVEDPAKELRSSYPCSRIRRSLLFSKAKELGISTIAFGHHKDDVNETALLNLLKKGSFEGMLPSVHMKKFQTTIIRPLYYVDEAECISFARLHDYLRISCKCPNGATSERQTVKTLLQVINKEIPDASNNLFHAIYTHGSKKALTP